MKHLILGLFILVSCSTPSKKEQESLDEKGTEKSQAVVTDYMVAISEVDNAVKVFMEDSLIFESGTVHGSPEVDFNIDLTPYVVNGDETLRIELWNGLEPYNSQIDPKWEIRFDLILKGEIADFVHEYNDDNRIGKVYEIAYRLDEW